MSKIISNNITFRVHQFSLLVLKCCQNVVLHRQKETEPWELEAAVDCRLNPPAQGGHCDSPGLENSNTPVSMPYKNVLALRSRSRWLSPMLVVHAIQLWVHSAAISKKFFPQDLQKVALGSYIGVSACGGLTSSTGFPNAFLNGGL